MLKIKETLWVGREHIEILYYLKPFPKIKPMNFKKNYEITGKYGQTFDTFKKLFIF